MKPLYKTEYDSRTPRDSFKNCLRNAAHQFHNKQGEQHYILAGYPWFNCRARDLFIALPGLTLALDEQAEFESAMQTATAALREFMEHRRASLRVYELEHPDVPLWFVWTLQQYAKQTSNEQCRERYGNLLRDVIDFIRRDGHPNLRLHANGLLHANGEDTAITWMNSTAQGRPIVPRTGYIVEFNALWYNALCFTASLYEDQAAYAADLRALAAKSGQAFTDTFLNEYGYLLDYVYGQMQDWSVRPNMIFAVALEHSPLTLKQKKGVLDTVTKELLTPKGLRSLSPKSGGYNPNYVGHQAQRDQAYHQGTAWPWLMGFYLEAYQRVYKLSGLSFMERQLDNFREEMIQHCIGTISELYDGNPPFKGRGATSFAMNVAEILRARRLLTKLNQMTQ
jgi:predicted glycogen debranching enzyme